MTDNNMKVRSSISDEDLARMIEDDKRRNPSDFSCGPIVYVDTLPTKDFQSVESPSRTFESIIKWL